MAKIQYMHNIVVERVVLAFTRQYTGTYDNKASGLALRTTRTTLAPNHQLCFTLNDGFPKASLLVAVNKADMSTHYGIVTAGLQFRSSYVEWCCV